MPVVSADYLPLFRILLAAPQLLQLLWSGALVGGAILSLAVLLQALRHRDPLRLRCAAELSGRLPASGLFALLYGLLTAVNLAGVYGGYRPPFLTLPLVGSTLVLLAAGLTLLVLYRRLLDRPRSDALIPLLIGAAGLALLLGALLLFALGGAALLKPEYWPYLDHHPLHFLSWNGLARLLLFLALALQLGGAVSLSATGAAAPEHQPYLLRRGMLLALLGLLLLPPGVVLLLLSLPVLARTLPGVLLPTLSLLLALPVCLRLSQRLLEGRSVAGRPLLAAMLAIVLLVGLGDHLSRRQVWADAAGFARQPVQPVPARPDRAAAPESAAELLSRGGEIFQERCSVCHKFDARLVGPPLLEVLPGYRGRSEALQQFIRQPEKRNPDYPAMPNLGLGQEEASAVSAYLLDRLDQH